jgi:hypothetical protein
VGMGRCGADLAALADMAVHAMRPPPGAAPASPRDRLQARLSIRLQLATTARGADVPAPLRMTMPFRLLLTDFSLHPAAAAARRRTRARNFTALRPAHHATTAGWVCPPPPWDPLSSGLLRVRMRA